MRIPRLAGGSRFGRKLGSRKVRTPQSMAPGNAREGAIFRKGPQKITAYGERSPQGKGEKVAQETTGARSNAAAR